MAVSPFKTPEFSMLKSGAIAAAVTLLAIGGVVLAFSPDLTKPGGLIGMGLLVWLVFFVATLPDFSELDASKLPKLRYQFLFILIIVVVLGGGAALLIDDLNAGRFSGSASLSGAATKISARDDCISQLRGLAEINAKLQGFTVVKIDQGEFVVNKDGSVDCKAQFLILHDGKTSYSQVFEGQVAGGNTLSKSGNAQNCTTTGPNSPIVRGENSVVVIDGKTYSQGQSADCAPSSTNISTHGVGSPIVTGAGSKVSIHVDQ